jgi:hypothetical protein
LLGVFAVLGHVFRLAPGMLWLLARGFRNYAARTVTEGLHIMPDVQAITVQTLSAPHRRSLQALRRPVIDAARSFGIVREKLTDLAPKVIKLFNAIVAEQERAVTFVDFCRMFDPSIPTHAADREGVIGYRNHRVYYTLAYMRRLVIQPTGRRGQQGVRDSATDALARTLATILQIVAEPESVWSAIQGEFGFSERLMTRLRKRVEATKPLIRLEATKPAKVGSVIHMDRLTPAPSVETEPMRQAGGRVVMPAPSEGPRARARSRAA